MKNSILYCIIIASGSLVIYAALTETILTRKDAPQFRIIGTPDIATRTVSSDSLNIRRAGGRFRYRSEDPSEAQQGWVMRGSVPTSHESFDTISQIRITASGEADVEDNEILAHASALSDTYGLDHTFFKQSDAVRGRRNHRLRQRFVYYPNRDEVAGEVVGCPASRTRNYGVFNANIRNGEMRFTYRINRANEGNMLIGMNEYGDIRDQMAEHRRIRGAADMEAGVGINGVMHTQSGEAQVRANRRAARTRF